MRRIALMVLRLFYIAPYYLYRIWKFGRQENPDFEEAYRYIKKVTKAANKAGRVTVKAYGLENLPKENGYIFFPNHQGLFDVLVFLDTCPAPFAFVYKKEVGNIILLKQVIKALGSIGIDREDIKQSLQVIRQMSAEVKEGKNFLIFPEGTRSKKRNQLLDFKGGSFKSAQMARCPIVPCALIDTALPFDEKSIRPVTVQIHYMPPLYYEEYRTMKSVEIAEEVKRRIEAKIAEVLEKTGENSHCEIPKNH